MKKIKILLFLFIVFISKSVFAQTTDVSNKIRYSPDTSGGTYYGDEIYLGGYNGQFSVNTRYNGQLSQIVFYLKDSDYSFQLNKTYTITLNMATSDWRNNFMGPLVYVSNSDGTITSGSPNWYVSNTFSFVSMKKIKFNIKPTGTIKPFTKFTIYSTNVNTTAFTGVNNWNLSSIIIDDNSSSSGSSGTTPTPTPTPNPTFDDTNIINNANENTQDIINNSDKNTSDIIENNNHNADIINESINAQCKNGLLVLSDDYYMKDNYYLDENGNEVADNSAAISIYFVIKPNSLYTISSPGGLAGNDYSICLYDSNKNLLAANSSRKCTSVNQYTNGIDSGPYAQYMRITIPKRWYATLGITGPICNNFTKESIDNASSAIGGAIQGGVSGIIDNQNANTDKVTDKIEDELNDCTTTNMDPVSTIPGYIARWTSPSGFAILNNGTGINLLAYELPEYPKTYSFKFLKGNRLRIVNTDALTPNYNTDILVNYDDYPVIGQTYSFEFTKKYVIFQLSSTSEQGEIEFQGLTICTNKLDNLNKGINDINDSLTDETVPDIDLDLDLDTSSPVSDLLTMPVTILNKVFDITDDTCQPYVLPFDFFGGNNTLTLPCIDLRHYLGNSVYNVLDTLLCFYLCYQIGMMCISIYEDITSLRDGFDSLYTPKHARPLGKHTKEVE